MANLGTRRGSHALALTAILLAIFPAAQGRGETASWLAPDLDTWVYPNAFSGSGTRVFAPSFGTGLSIDPTTQQLNRGNATRLGYLVVAFETTDAIEPGIAPERYLIDSVTLTARSERGQGGDLIYETDPLTPAGALADVAAGEFGDQLPMELFGVGFTGGFDGFALGSDQTGQRFTEANEGWSGGDYVLFPTEAESGRDVVNSLNGGFSATEPTGETDPFLANPFAIGQVDGAADGDRLPNDTTFRFDLDLTLPGLTGYVQQSLSEGVVGFTISSLQTGTQPGEQGGSPYPQWYTKEATGLFQGAQAATLTIDFQILPIPGDYDGDGQVTTTDHDAWSAAYGSAVTPEGTGADGNGDGIVDAADYAVWRDAFATAPIAVPEPGAGTYALMGLTAGAFCLGTYAYTSPRGPRR